MAAVKVAKRGRTRVIYTRVRSRRKAEITLPLAVIAGFAPLAMGVVSDYKLYGIEGTLAGISARLTGYNPQIKTWHAGTMKEGLLPIFAGLLVHKFVGSKLGVNRMLASSHIPFIRV